MFNRVTKSYIKKIIKIAMIIGTICALSACAKKPGSSGYGEGEIGEGVGDNMRFFGTNLSAADERSLIANRTYYFDYDSFHVKDEDAMSVYAHAKKIAGKSKIRVRIEGHTDERGSREYNIALGEKRAQAIANLLTLKGVPQSQVNIVSYGKEKPAVYATDESGWSKNRRAVIVYEVE